MLMALQQHAPYDTGPSDGEASPDDFDWESMFDEANQDLLGEE